MRPNAFQPGADMLARLEQPLRGRVASEEHVGVIAREIGEARRIAQQEGASVGELTLEAVQVGAQLQELRRHDHAGPREIDTGRHLLAVLDERLVEHPAGAEKDRHGHHEAGLRPA